MSVLDHPPHRVDVQLRTGPSQDKRGNTVRVSTGAPVTVPCSCQPLSATEIDSFGLRTETVRKIICRSWPGDINSQVLWDGHEWDTVADPEHFSMSPATDHWELLIKKGRKHGQGV